MMNPLRPSFRRAALLLAAAVILCGFWFDSMAARQTGANNAARKSVKGRAARQRARRKSRPRAKQPLSTHGPANASSDFNRPAPGSPESNVNAGEEPPPPPRPAPTPRRNIISGGVLNGKAIYKPQPVYPPIARAARASGTVVVQVVVGEDGSVISASAVSGHPLLQAAAVKAVRQWRFPPTLLSGQPVKVSGVVSVNFKLDSKPSGPVA